MQSHQTAATSMHAMHFALQCTVSASPSCALSVLHLVHQCTSTAGSKAEADTSWTRVCLKLTLTPRNPVQFFFIKVALSFLWVVALIFSDQLKSSGKSICEHFTALWIFFFFLSDCDDQRMRRKEQDLMAISSLEQKAENGRKQKTRLTR